MKPRIVVMVAPHERNEAIDAWRDKLTPEQIEDLMEAPETEWVTLEKTGTWPVRRPKPKATASSD
jgi:hypothetical protein